VRKTADAVQAQLILYDSNTDFDEWKAMLTAQIKRIKETAKKEYKFEWALERLEELENISSAPHMTKELNKIENAKMEIKMDEHDYEVPVLATGNESTFLENYGAYLLGVIAAAGVGAGVYYKYKQK
jgi:hypothetical protein